MNTRKMNQAFQTAFNPPQCSPDGGDAEAWLTDKIRHYESEAARLETQLTHVKILLKGHRTWLSDCQRRKGAK